MLPGIDVLLRDAALVDQLKGKAVALLGHPASVTRDGAHSLDALSARNGLRLTCAFGPQHGMRGDKQDNMIESEDYTDPRYGIPVFSLYGEHRRPTPEMMASFDLLLVDLQDIGTRIYTFVTTTFYMIEACAQAGKSVWILDRPNPAGRPVEGSVLEAGWESMVGAAPMMMRHGMTLGELARWFVAYRKLDVGLCVVNMEGYRPQDAPGFGWPVMELAWVNPSPNASSPNMARCFPGTVLFEATTLSEGRGTTTPLETIGAPDISMERVLDRMRALADGWLKGCLIRPCCFEPTFHKHAHTMCSGLQIHTDTHLYRHDLFRPYRIAALLLKSIKLERPDYELWRIFPYEYETERMAVDLLSGGTFLREWVDEPSSAPADLETRLRPDEARWEEERAPYLAY